MVQEITMLDKRLKLSPLSWNTVSSGKDGSSGMIPSYPARKLWHRGRPFFKTERSGENVNYHMRGVQ